MKAFIVILMALTYQISFAKKSILVAQNSEKAPAVAHPKEEGQGMGHKEKHEEQEKDWNEIFKQPVANVALSEMPTSTQVVEPAFLSQVKGSEVTLKWKAVEGVKYHLQVATDPNFKWLVVNEPLVSYTEYPLKNLQPKTQYFWRVYTQKPDNSRGYTKGQPAGSEFEVQ